MKADVNLFGLGNGANATVGPATRQIAQNMFQMIPRISEAPARGIRGNAVFGSPNAHAAIRGRCRAHFLRTAKSR